MEEIVKLMMIESEFESIGYEFKADKMKRSVTVFGDSKKTYDEPEFDTAWPEYDGYVDGVLKEYWK